MHIKKLLGIFMLCCISQLQAQEKDNTATALAFNFEYGMQIPGGDLIKRFGNSLFVGAGMELLHKSNFAYGICGNYTFSNSVKEDVLAPYRTPEGEIIANNRAYASLSLRQRGYYVGAYVGKLFALNAEKNKRSGIRVNLGAGLLQHWIRLQDDYQNVNLVSNSYKVGFDRLSGGLGLQQFVGYQHLSKKRTINFMVGIEAREGFTKSWRSYNFTTLQAESTDSRFDMYLGVKAVWTLPLYIGQPAEEIYY